MSFPYLSEVNFEDGTLGSFDTETDTTGILDFPHYSELARIPGMAMPFRGAYCMRVALNGGTTVAKVVETGDWDMALDEVQFWRFQIWLDPKLSMANTDIFDIFVLESSADTNQVTVSIQFTTANGFRIGVGQTAGNTQLTNISLGEWHNVELNVSLDAGGGNDGAITLSLDGTALTTVGSLDQLAVVQGYIGVDNPDATTTGTILFDGVISDDTNALGPITRRFDETVKLTKTGHAFIGPCQIDNVSLLSGGATDNVLRLFDTDEANTDDTSSVTVELNNTANNETVDPAGMPVELLHGCYIEITGTNPSAIVALGKRASAWGSDGAIRNYARKR